MQGLAQLSKVRASIKHIMINLNFSAIMSIYLSVLLLLNADSIECKLFFIPVNANKIVVTYTHLLETKISRNA